MVCLDFSKVFDTAQPERKRLRRDLIDVHRHQGGCKEDRARLSSVVLNNRMRDSGHKLKHTRFSKYQEIFFHCGGDLEMAQVGQGAGGVSIFRGN